MKTIFFSLAALLFTFSISYAQPILDFTEPIDDYIWVDPGRDKIELQFNQEVFKGSGNLTVFDAGTDAIVDQISASSSDINILLYSPDVVSVTLSNSLGAGRSFYILADHGFLKDAGDNDWSGISNKTVWNFSTRSYDPSGPMIISMNPDAGSAMVDYASPLQVTIYFDKFLSKGSGSISIKDLNLGSTASYDINHVDVSVLDQVIILSNVSVAADTEYSIKLDEGIVVDYFGNQNDGTSEPNRYTFKTIPASGLTPPAKLAIKYPRDDSQEVPVNFDQLRLSFDQDVNIGTGSIDLYEQSGDNLVSSFDVSFSYAWNGVAYVNFHTNNFELQPNTSYYILMNDGAFKTQSDNSNVAGISDKTTWTFTTEASDGSAPMISDIIPMDDQTDVSILTSAFLLAFDEKTFVEVDNPNIRIYKSDGDELVKEVKLYGKPGPPVGIPEGPIFTSRYYSFNAGEILEPSTDYYILMDGSQFEDKFKNSFGGISDKAIWNFTTENSDETAPIPNSFYPDRNSPDVAVTVRKLEIDFNEMIRFGDGGKVRLYRSDNNELVASWTKDNPNIEIDNNYRLDAEFFELLEPSTGYYVLIDEGFIVDIFGNAFGGFNDNSSWTFTTTASDHQAPLITSLEPTDNAADVPINQDYLVVTFDELVFPATYSPELRLFRSSDDLLVSKLRLNGDMAINIPDGEPMPKGSSYFFYLDEYLEHSTSYYITIDQDQFTDQFGIPFAGISEKDAWNFETEAAETDPPTISHTLLRSVNQMSPWYLMN